MEPGFGHILFINILYFNADAAPTGFWLSLTAKEKTSGTIHNNVYGVLTSFFLLYKEQQSGSGIDLARNISPNCSQMSENTP